MLRAYEKALDMYPKADHRMRIEHAYGMPTENQFERMGKKGILALKHGITIAGGSDSPVTTLNPLLGIHYAVNHPVEEQRVDVREALRWFTINAAHASFEEKMKGSVSCGKLADLTVLEGSREYAEKYK